MGRRDARKEARERTEQIARWWREGERRGRRLEKDRADGSREGRADGSKSAEGWTPRTAAFAWRMRRAAAMLRRVKGRNVEFGSVLAVARGRAA